MTEPGTSTLLGRTVGRTVGRGAGVARAGGDEAGAAADPEPDVSEPADGAKPGVVAAGDACPAADADADPDPDAPGTSPGVVAGAASRVPGASMTASGTASATIASARSRATTAPPVDGPARRRERVIRQSYRRSIPASAGRFGEAYPSAMVTPVDVGDPLDRPIEPVTPSAEAQAAFLADVVAELPDLRVLTEASDREANRNDETAYLAGGLPLAVALPTTTEEVSALVRLAARHRIPIVPRGAGTGLSGGAAGIDGGITISFVRMNRILEIDPLNLVVVTQPGIINADLKKAVAAEGLFYAPDPASYEMCSIGGNLGTNAGGLCCVKYGQTRDSVLGLEVVLADGTVIRTGGRNVKDVAGYSLTHLIVGSQGTLGIVTEAILRLRPAPPPRTTLLAFFATLDAAGDAVARITAAGLNPVTLELMDRATIIAVDDWHHLGLDHAAAAMLMVESDLPAIGSEAELAEAVIACEAAGATSIVRAKDAQEADWLRQARRLALRALERIGTVRMEDVGVPRSRVPDLLRAIDRICARHGVRVATFGHAGDGNLHPNFIFERDDPNAKEMTERVRDDLFRAALELGGTVTAEHGIGTSRREFLELQRGREAVRAMRSIKAALDPLGILNPGKVV